MVYVIKDVRNSMKFVDSNPNVSSHEVVLGKYDNINKAIEEHKDVIDFTDFSKHLNDFLEGVPYFENDFQNDGVKT